jgi:hypothetical protein
MKRLPIIILVVVAAVALTTAALATGHEPDPPQAKMSNAGSPLQRADLDERSIAGLAEAGVSGQLRELATRAGRRFIVAPAAAAGRLCFMTAQSAKKVSLDFVACQGASGQFPSAREPLADFSPRFSNDPQNPSDEVLRVLRLTGFAADGVAQVSLIAVDGSVESVPVRGNVYFSDRVSAGPHKAIVALDAAGNVLETIPLTG